MRTRAQDAGSSTKPRFRIQRLEERIAPKKGGIPGQCGYCNYYFCYDRVNPHGKLIGSWKCHA